MNAIRYGGFTAALLVSLSLLSCHDEPDLCAPLVPAGRIEGHVRTGGLSAVAEISIRPVIAGDGYTRELRAEADSTGFYSMDVPEGNYLVRASIDGYGGHYYFTREGPSYGQLAADTLHVGTETPLATADFDLGGVVFEATVPGRLNGRWCKVVLHPEDLMETPSPPTIVDDSKGEIVSGAVRVEIPGVMPARYQVEVVLGCDEWSSYGRSDGEHYWLPGTRDRDQADLYRVVADSVVSLEQELPIESTGLRGRVTGAWHDLGLSEKPRLTVVTPDSTVIVHRLYTDDDGGFEVDLAIAGPVKVQVTHRDIGQWIGGPRMSDATVFDLTPGEILDGIEHIESGFRLRVGPPLFSGSTMRFRLLDPDDNSLVTTFDVGSQGQGHRGVPNLWPGEYLLQILPAEWVMGRMPWRPQYFNCGTTPDQAQPIDITTPGDIAVLDLTLEYGGIISGRVGPGEMPPQYFHIVITSACDRVIWGYTYGSEPSFTFDILGLPDGDFKIGARPPDLGWPEPGGLADSVVWHPGTTDWQAATVFTVDEASVIDDVVIEVP